jgi:peptidoglycan hydrolase-like protein with peptidoglycan-binding domain
MRQRATLRQVLLTAIGTALLVVVGVSIGVGLHHSSTPTGPAPSSTHGFDVSWPQCAGDSAGNMPGGRPSYLILGLTHGAGDTINPCLGSQLDWAKSRGVRVGAYLVPSYPDKAHQALAANGMFGACGTSVRCELRNNGAAQAQAALATMQAAGLRPPRVWIDVEVSTVLPWSPHALANIAVLRGVVAALRAAHIPIGVYTTSAMWTEITRGYRLNVTNWLPSGDGKARHAAAMCDTTATGGPTWLVQYTRSLDMDLTCPILNAVPGRHGGLWPFRNSTEKLLSHGLAVRALQQVVGIAPSGNYDAATTVAVSAWQSSNGLPVTGTVAPLDWRAMGAYRTYGGHPFWLSRVVSPS